MNSISLKRLIQMGLTVSSDCTLYTDKCVVMSPVTKGSMIDGAHLIEYPAFVEPLSLLLVEEGGISICCDEQKERLERGTLFIGKPHSIMRVEAVDDNMQCTIVLLDNSVLDNLNVSVQKIIPCIGRSSEKQGILLARDEMSFVKHIFETLIYSIRQDPRNIYYHEQVQSHVLSVVYFLLNMVSKTVKEREAAVTEPLVRGEEYYRRFMELLQKNYRKERKIAFYANEMCLSPKYLSSVIRKFSGKSPSAWIDGFVIAEARKMIKYSDLSIQEIALELNFSTQSFFGRYFKTHTGYSPKAFRYMK